MEACRIAAYCRVVGVWARLAECAQPQVGAHGRLQAGVKRKQLRRVVTRRGALLGIRRRRQRDGAKTAVVAKLHCGS